MPDQRSDREERPSPDALLAQARREEQGRLGHLKIFVGAAPGVGKTYEMLQAARAKLKEGVDVVVGVVETHGRKETEALLEGFEVLPRKPTVYVNRIMSEFDVDAALRRRPKLILVDELAHTNVPGSRHAKRYLDVEELLNAGIDVYTTVNIQHIESVAPTVNVFTGVVVRETVPDWVLQMSAETVMVDLTPEALQNRMKRGDVYGKEKVEQSLRNFFRRGNLIALRELALRQVAEQVDRSLASYMDEKDIQENWAVRERLAVCISSNPRAQYLLARAARMARRMDAELYAVHVDLSDDESPEDAKSLETNLKFAESLGASVVRLQGHSVPGEAAKFVREKHITQMIFGRTATEGLNKLRYMNAISRFLRDAPAVDVHIVTQEPD